MQRKAAIVSIGLASVLSACYSEFPIDQRPQAKLDSTLFGTWRCLPPDPQPDTDPVNFVLSEARPGVYAIRFEVKDENPGRFEAHFSIVKGHPLLNVRDVDAKSLSKPWLFARYSFPLPHVLRVQVVQEDIFKSVQQTPAGYRRVLEGLGVASPAYREFAICTKARADGSAWN